MQRRGLFGESIVFLSYAFLPYSSHNESLFCDNGLEITPTNNEHGQLRLRYLSVTQIYGS
jgi:hypothetical protein